MLLIFSVQLPKQVNSILLSSLHFIQKVCREHQQHKSAEVKCQEDEIRGQEAEVRKQEEVKEEHHSHVKKSPKREHKDDGTPSSGK